mmetsp:Transcript_3011/g.6677  ORF Transcript_3011/g.6677 Transcript_3011/m.6677 type:complete len:212 (-) Transcript_3011:794-1429(-)
MVILLAHASRLIIIIHAPKVFRCHLLRFLLGTQYHRLLVFVHPHRKREVKHRKDEAGHRHRRADRPTFSTGTAELRTDKEEEYHEQQQCVVHGASQKHARAQGTQRLITQDLSSQYRHANGHANHPQKHNCQAGTSLLSPSLALLSQRENPCHHKQHAKCHEGACREEFPHCREHLHVRRGSHSYVHIGVGAVYHFRELSGGCEDARGECQ